MLGIQDILRASDVKRWIIVRTVKEQSVAEHTFNVVMIARAIAKKAGVDDSRIIKAALEHDLDEISTGDIPTPAKRHHEIKIPHLGKTILLNIEIDIIKVADLMEAYWFIDENAIGRHAIVVRNNLRMGLNRLLTTPTTDIKVKRAANGVWEEITKGKFAYE